jgi:hypothetical protein
MLIDAEKHNAALDHVLAPSRPNNDVAEPCHVSPPSSHKARGTLCAGFF